MDNYETYTYRLELCCPGMGVGPEQPVIGATAGERLSLSQYGFRIENPYDVRGNITTFPLPFRAGAGIVTSGYIGARDVLVTGTVFDDTSYGLWNSVARDYLIRWLSIAAVRRDTYLRIGLWNGSYFTYFRLYCVLRDANIPLVPGTTMTVGTPVALNFHAYDPVIYEDTEGVMTADIRWTHDNGNRYGGAHTNTVALGGANRPIHRSVFYWSPPDDNPVQRVVVQDTLNGITLTANTFVWGTGQKVVVDNWNGLLYAGPTTAFTNKIDKMEGTFWWSGRDTAKFWIQVQNFVIGSEWTWYGRFLKPAARYFQSQQY